MSVDAALRALAHPARRAMLHVVGDGELSSSELAEQVELSRPATSQHLKVLREAGLVQVRADGNQRLYRVDPALMDDVRHALEDFWGDRLGRLAGAVADRARADG